VHCDFAEAIGGTRQHNNADWAASMRWTWWMLGFWAVIGLPALMIHATFDGGFDPIPAAAPFFRSGQGHLSIGTNASWLFAVVIVYGPIVVLTVAALWRWIGGIIREDRLGP
jgi:hypothetical protein